MEKISSRQLAFVFPGLFFGAGFVSGQELFQFFGIYGVFGIFACFAAVFMFMLFTWIIIKITQGLEIKDFAHVVIYKEKSILGRFFEHSANLFLFICVVVMVAGCGSLFNQIFNIPIAAGNTIFAAILLILTFTGQKGVVNTLSVVTPYMAIICFVTAVFAAFRLDLSFQPSALINNQNPLIGNILIAAITFISYNMLPAISVIIVLSNSIDERDSGIKGILGGGGILFFISLSIIIPMITHREIVGESDLPMMVLAQESNRILGILYGLLLFAGMLGSALACLFAFFDNVKKIGPIEGNGRYPLVMAVSVAFSLLGFKELVAKAYPIFGYIGFAVLIFVLIHYYKIKHINKK